MHLKTVTRAFREARKIDPHDIEALEKIRARWVDEDGHLFDWSVRGSALAGVQAVKDLATLFRLLDAVMQERDERIAARDKAFSYFGHQAVRDEEGKCCCPYCTGNADELVEMTAEYELQKFAIEQRADKFKAERDALAAELTAVRRRAECLPEPHVSRCCELGSKGCNVRHADLAAELTRLKASLASRMTEAEWRRTHHHRPHSFRPDQNGECLECGYPQFHVYHDGMPSPPLVPAKEEK